MDGQVLTLGNGSSCLRLIDVLIPIALFLGVAGSTGVDMAMQNLKVFFRAGM